MKGYRWRILGWRAITRCSKRSNSSSGPNRLAEVRANRLLTYVRLYKVRGGWNLTDAQWSGSQAKRQEQ